MEWLSAMTLNYTSCTSIESQAEKLGIYKLPQLTLYTQPRYVHMRLRGTRGWMSSCLIDATEQLLRALHFEFNICYTHFGYRRFLLSPQLMTLARFKIRLAGNRRQPKSHCTRIDIWAEADMTEQIVERLIWAQNGDPIDEGIDWEKLERAFKIQREKAIAQWRVYMSLK